MDASRSKSKDYESLARNTYESEEDLPPFPVQDYSPNGYPMPAPMKAPQKQTQKNTNNYDLSLSESSSSVTKNKPGIIKRLASKYSDFKAKFNSAPNIPNTLDSADSKKSQNHKSSSNTQFNVIGNSIFFNNLSKTEESGAIVCTHEFETLSLSDEITLNRDSVVNRSNHSCPVFKTSLPNIVESSDSESGSAIITEIDCDKNSSDESRLSEAINYNNKMSISSENLRQDKVANVSIRSNVSNGSDLKRNKLLDITKKVEGVKRPAPPPPPPRISARQPDENNIYENVTIDRKIIPPIPAARTHIPKVPSEDVQKKIPSEESPLDSQAQKISTISSKNSTVNDKTSSISSRSYSVSSDDSDLIDEANLEDIFLSKKSKSFRLDKNDTTHKVTKKSVVDRTHSFSSISTDITEASALEHVDVSGYIGDKEMYMSMTGTLPSKKAERPKKKVLFRHKTFTNIEADRNSIKVIDLPRWDSEFLKETLANYHIRGTGHCMYNAPTVEEFIYIFNRDTLYSDVPPFEKVPYSKRESYYETAICFCKPKPRKLHNSAEDLLQILDVEEKVSIQFSKTLKTKQELKSSSFRCFCTNTENCKLHSDKKETCNDFIVKFSAVKKSISTPNITLAQSPTTTYKSIIPKNKLVPQALSEEPYASVTIEDIMSRQNKILSKNEAEDPMYTVMSSQASTLTSDSSGIPYSLKDISDVISLNTNSLPTESTISCVSGTKLRKSSSSEYSGHWSLQSCNSNNTIKSDTSFKTCVEESSDENSDSTLHSDDDDDSSDTDTIKSDISNSKRPWVHSDSFRFDSKNAKFENDVIPEEECEETSIDDCKLETSSKFESGISVGSVSSSSECEDDSILSGDNVLGVASLERMGSGGDCSGLGRRRWEEAEGTSEGDALSVSSAASSCAPHHLAHHHDYSKVSPTPPKKPPRRNLSVSPTHANSPSSGYSYELRAHARSQDDLDDIQGAKHYLKHGRSVDQYVDGKLSYPEYEENHNSPRLPVPHPRPSLKNRSQPIAITAMYENVEIKEQNPKRKLRRNNFGPSDSTIMNETRVRKYSAQERSSLESLLDDQSMNSPSDCERYSEGHRVPLSPTHYEQPPTPDHPPPSAKQAENSIHEKIRPLSQLIMEVVEEIRIRKKTQADVLNTN